MKLEETEPARQLLRENTDLIAGSRDLARIMYSVHISLRHRFIFVETPKAACSTMKLLLQKLEVNEREWHRWGFHLHDRQFSPLLNPLQVPSFARLRTDPEFKKFCVVRSPHTRLLSAYLDKICRGGPHREIVLRLLRKPIDDNCDISFADFVQAVTLQDPSDMDFHWMPQSLLLMTSSFAYDLILRAEELDRDILGLGALLGLDLLPFYHRVEAGRTDARLRMSEHYFDPDLFELGFTNICGRYPGVWLRRLWRQNGMSAERSERS